MTTHVGQAAPLPATCLVVIFDGIRLSARWRVSSSVSILATGLVLQLTAGVETADPRAGVVEEL